MAGRPRNALTLAEDERMQLESMVRSRSLPAALTQRAKIVLACAAGATGAAVARRFETTNATVGKWRRRFIERRISGLYDELRSGKPRTIDDERVAELINTTLHTEPSDGTTHRSARALEAETAISKSSVQRYLKLFAVQPHRTERQNRPFRLSSQPELQALRVDRYRRLRHREATKNLPTN